MFEIDLKRDGNENLYTQIYEKIRAEILADKYTPDTKMPSIRKLASRLNVNAETVVKAYDLLAAENLIYKQEGSGSYIAPAAALKNNENDHRLRILSSNQNIKAKKKIDLSGPEYGQEFLEEYSWDLIFDRFYSEFRGNSFEFKDFKKSSYFQTLNSHFKSSQKERLLFDSKEKLKNILTNIIDLNKEILVSREDNISTIKSLFQENQNKQETFNNNLNLVSPEYQKVMDFLEENKVDYLIISDESLSENILDWSYSKLNSLLELAEMLKFKIIIFRYFAFYQENKNLTKLMEAKNNKHLILIQNLTVRVFPGLDSGLIFIDSANYSESKQKHLQQYSLNNFKNNVILSAGDNLVYNLLDYFIDHNYLEKRIKLLKQRLKNRRLLIENAVKEHFRGAELLKVNSLFYLKIKLNQPINLYDFKIFAEKNSLYLVDYNDFSLASNSSELIISPAVLNQFSIKYAVMALAKIYWKFIS